LTPGGGTLTGASMGLGSFPWCSPLPLVLAAFFTAGGEAVPFFAAPGGRLGSALPFTAGLISMDGGAEVCSEPGGGGGGALLVTVGGGGGGEFVAVCSEFSGFLTLASPAGPGLPFFTPGLGLPPMGILASPELGRGPFCPGGLGAFFGPVGGAFLAWPGSTSCGGCGSTGIPITSAPFCAISILNAGKT
jgi:hypothetical protein